MLEQSTLLKQKEIMTMAARWILLKQNKLKKVLTLVCRSYVSKLAGLQCFDTVEQNGMLWNAGCTLFYHSYYIAVSNSVFFRYLISIQ
jgi:hypothetical protein